MLHQSRGWGGRRVSPVFLCFLGLLVLTGCSTEHYRRSADREVYGIIRELEARMLGKTNDFTIDTRYSARKPDSILPSELIEDRLQTNRRTLSIEGALELATKNSRKYQTERERLYLTTLTLTESRYAFAPQPFANSTAKMTRTGPGGRVDSVNTQIGVDQVLKTGGSLGLKLANDLLRYYSGDPSRSVISVLSINLAQPLLRGFGKNNPQVEALTQTERNAVYALRNYSYFQNQYALKIVTDYFNLLMRKDEVRNQYANYLSRVTNTVRLEARKDRESRPGVDQARQSELRAKNTYINAVANYFDALDTFKIELGLPLGEKLYLDDEALKEIARVGPIAVALPREAAYRLGVEKQLTVLNAIDTFEDKKRKIHVAADRLRADLNIFADASLQSDAPVDYTTFDPNRWRGGVGIKLDLPIDRLTERNVYRTSLINFEAELRNLTLTLDDLRDRIEGGLRTLQQRYQNFVIQTNSLALAEDQVASTTMMQEAGRADVRDIIDAQDAMIVGQNAVTSSLVDYQAARLQLLLDIGILDATKEKFWLRDELSAYFDQSAAAELRLDLPRGELIPPEVFFNQ